jgi:NAD(P)-dependent dehydrogenase (short-subunit alcohol dehydrogenase family)
VKTVLVTGGGGAIGAAICRRFSKDAKVLVADRNREAAERVAREVNGKSLVFDISKYEDAKKALAAEAIDILVNNAGWDRFQNFTDTKPEEWDALIDINLRGPLNMHHLVIPQMLQRGSGRVINISSDAARVGSSGEAVYSACKGGIIAFSKTLAREVARTGHHGQRGVPRPHRHADPARLPRRGRGRAEGLRRAGARDPDEARRPAQRHSRHRRLPRFRRGGIHHGTGDQRFRRTHDGWLISRNPSCTARITAAAAVCTSSLRYAFLMWVTTVCGDMPRRTAACS